MSPVRPTCVPPHSSTDQAPRLVGLAAHLDDADLVTVFLAEQRQRAKLDGGVRGHDAGRNLAVHANAFIDDGLYPCQLLGRNGARVREIETKPVGRDKRALLGHMSPRTWRSAS